MNDHYDKSVPERLRHVPRAKLVRCGLPNCKIDEGWLNIEEPDFVCRQVIDGWMPVNRSAGGANCVYMQVYANRWAHNYCVEQARKGTTNQGRLF